MLFVVDKSSGADRERAQSDRGHFDKLYAGVDTNDLSKSVIGMDQQTTPHELIRTILQLPQFNIMD